MKRDDARFNAGHKELNWSLLGQQGGVEIDGRKQMIMENAKVDGQPNANILG